MEYLINLKFEDKGYNAIIHFVATFTAENRNEANLFVNELKSGFEREGVIIFQLTHYRIDNDPILKERSYEYCMFYKSKATAYVEIEQFSLENPDQNKSLFDNLKKKLFSGESATANIGNKYKIPVKVLDKETRNPITNELFYFSIEHLIPRK